MKNLLVIAVLIMSASLAFSDEYITSAIKSVGCHKNDNICFIEVDSKVGPSGCNQSSVRWETEKEAAGQSALSLFTAAYFAGKRVRLKVSDTCFEYQSAFPTFDWYYIFD